MFSFQGLFASKRDLWELLQILGHLNKTDLTATVRELPNVQYDLILIFIP